MLLKPQTDFIVANKLPSVRLCHAFLDGSAEASILFNLHQRLGIDTGMGGDL